MTLTELATEYREGAALLKQRIEELKEKLKTEKMREIDKLRLRIRIERLQTMMRETSEAAVYMEKYYEKRNRKNGRFTI